jgi:acetyl-CoA carboxylase, biotin carboxylase subunit
MFNKILIANRGEIAVRVIRACRELGIPSLAVYEAEDSDSLHVRMADECVLLTDPEPFSNPQTLIQVARDKGADAIHPGYGFLAESADFIRACQEAGLTFIGPPAEVAAQARSKVSALAKARAAGFATVAFSPECYTLEEDQTDPKGMEALRQAADKLGYPLLVKPCTGGRGRGQRLANHPAGLEGTVRRAQAEAQAVYGDRRVYLEKPVAHAYSVVVQIAADRYGSAIHLGERAGLALHGNQKVIEESPAACLKPEQRQRLWETALALARLFEYENIGSVEFVVDPEGNFFFSEIKARIQVDHPLTEMAARVDLVQEGIRLAAGEPLSLTQEQVHLSGWALHCRISAGDPWRGYLPEAGRLQQVRLPGGPEVRVDTYVYSGCEIPVCYDPLLAKVTVWGQTREVCLARMQRALEELKLSGLPTNQPVLQLILRDPGFAQGKPPSSILEPPPVGAHIPAEKLRDLAIAAAVLYLRQHRSFQPVVPQRLMTGWHRESRQPSG